MTGKNLFDRTILLGVTGGIAAYKVVDLASRLVKLGAAVDVVMTAAAKKFVTPLSFQSLTHRTVHADMWELHDLEPDHTALADAADLVVIAPVTANTLAKLAHGLADNLLTSVLLATQAPVLVAPAMEESMWTHPATQTNVALLRERGVVFVGPDEGRLATGKSGLGRMAEPARILAEILEVLDDRADVV